MCVIEAVVGEPPFAYLTDDLVLEYLKSGKSLVKPDEMTDNVWGLVVSMTSTDPRNRPSLQHVIEQLKALAVHGSTRERVDTIPVNAESVSSSVAQIGSRPRAQNVDRKPSNVVDLTQTTTTTTPPVPVTLPALTTDTPVPTLINAIRIGGSSQRVQALILLLQACVDDDQRNEIYEANGVSVLVDVVKSNRSHFDQVCALECLRWTKYDDHEDASLPFDKYKALRRRVRGATSGECAAITKSLRGSLRQKKVKAAVYCACIAELGFDSIDTHFLGALVEAGVISPLQTLLKNGDEWLKLWAAQALGNLAQSDEERGKIECRDVLAPLMTCLQSGTETLKRLAACAVGCFAKDTIMENVVSIDEVAALLLELLENGDDSQKGFALFALGFISDSSYGAKKGIIKNVVIAPLIEYLRTGTDPQKEHAAHLVGSLADNDAYRKKIVKAGAIASLVALLRDSTNGQKMHAAYALGRLAINDKNCRPIVDEGTIPLVVELLQAASDKTKEYAMHVLGHLAVVDTYDVVIGESGAISRLARLLDTGSDDLKDQALTCLRVLVEDNEANSVKAVKCGVSAHLANFMESGPDEYKFFPVSFGISCQNQ